LFCIFIFSYNVKAAAPLSYGLNGAFFFFLTSKWEFY